ncbi:MAG: 4Fe-4S dicluster domain-containing protein [Proteobacteria bacterium]|nr:4Fe-4S dicluster domain-containing protein [Pseudomonadota bacterium]
MSEDVYTRLREFMDTLPAGYPATDSGVEIKILKKLYTPEQAEITMKLTEEPEEVAAIAARIGRDESELASKLEEMAQKGIIFRVREGDKKLYRAFQFIVGIYEFQLKTLDREFSELFEEYLLHIGMSWANIQTSQMRVIPLESAVGVSNEVATYNRVRELVEQQEIFSVSQCICRKEQELLDNPCSYPQESCIGLGDFAQYYIDNNMARQLSQDEVFKVLETAEEAGLVLCPTNSQEVMAICCCCSCCCPTLKFAKLAPRPADVVTSHYQARIDPDLCTACEECNDRCPMDAIATNGDASEIDDGRCIGCGVCYPTCPAEAISMVAKPGMDAPPSDFEDTFRRIKAERGIAG